MFYHIIVVILNCFFFGFLSGCLSPTFGPLAPVEQPKVSSSLVSEVLMRIQLDYANPEKMGMDILIEGIFSELERNFAELRISSQQTDSEFSYKLWTTSWKYKSITKPLKNFSNLNAVLQTIHHKLILSPLDIQSSKLEQILLRGLTRQLDPYTAVLPRELHREFRVSVDGSFAGVGLMVGFRKNQLMVISPMVGSSTRDDLHYR